MDTFFFFLNTFGIFPWIFLGGCLLFGFLLSPHNGGALRDELHGLFQEHQRLRAQILQEREAVAKRAPEASGAPKEEEETGEKSTPSRNGESKDGAIAERTTPQSSATPPSPPPKEKRSLSRENMRNDRQLGPVYFLAPKERDPLEEIDGISSSQIKDLHTLGIYRFQQIASWNEGQLRACCLLMGLDLKTIQEQDWVAQATALHATRHEHPVGLQA
ncbi:MAG: hypothetical protein AAGJ31_03890 [Verrucomicrobiota bacterium]